MTSERHNPAWIRGMLEAARKKAEALQRRRKETGIGDPKQEARVAHEISQWQSELDSQQPVDQ